MHTATRCDHEIPAGWEPSPPRPGTPLVPQLPEPKKAEPCCADDPLQVQVGGSHYKHLKIEPIEYIMANNLDYCSGNVIKYITRFRRAGSPINDLNKAKHYIEFLISEIMDGRQKNNKD